MVPKFIEGVRFGGRALAETFCYSVELKPNRNTLTARKVSNGYKDVALYQPAGLHWAEGTN